MAAAQHSKCCDRKVVWVQIPPPTTMKSKSFYLPVLIGTWILTVILYFWFIKTSYFETFNLWTQQNLLVFYLTLFSVKVIAIVWPPIPGSLLTLGSISLIGWLPAYLVDLAGGLTGASIAFFLGEKYGYPFLEKLFNPELVEKIKQIKIRRNREIESVFLGRVAGGGNIMELVCYGAGVLRIRFRSFLIASFLTGLLTIPIYYLGGNIFSGNSILVGVAFGLITLFIFYKLKGRYVE